MKRLSLPILILLGFYSTIIFAQTVKDTLLQQATLQDCIQFALTHQPSLKQSLLDEQIVDQEIKSKLADWYPQINLNFNVQHYFKLPTSVFQGNTVHLGSYNTSNGQLAVTQNIFNKDVLLAASSAGDVRQQAAQSTASSKIDVIVNVSKAYYSVLLAQNQVDLVNQDITRLVQSQKDAYNQYKDGIVDKTDYERATIALNNARAEKKHDEELLKTSKAALKEQMGYPSQAEIELVYDQAGMEKDIFIDTTQSLNINNRIEYQILQTQKNLQIANLHYYEWSFIPSLSAIGAYNFNYYNDQFSQLYNRDYPSSYIGLQLSFPIFEGTKRIHELEQANLEIDQFDFETAALKNSINTEYVQALANYKSDLASFYAQKENLKLARDVYNTIQLQYKSGVKTYLDVITSETDLRTTQVNYINALYQVLSGKVDLEKALGTIQY